MSIYDLKVKNRKGEEVSLSDLKGKVLIPIVKKMDPDYANNSNIKWIFTKFLVDKEGNVVERFESTVEPKKIDEKIANII